MEGMRGLTLASINNGALEEMFQREMKEVLKNVDDVNTEPKKPRKITLEISIIPNGERNMGIIELAAKSALVPVKSVGSSVIFRNNGRNLEAFEPDFHQPTFGFDAGNVKDFKSRAAGEREDD